MEMAIPGAHRIAAQANLVAECIETVIVFSRESLALVDDRINRDIACYVHANLKLALEIMATVMGNLKRSLITGRMALHLVETFNFLLVQNADVTSTFE